MRTESERKAAYDAFQAQLKSDEIAHENFRYSDAQREQAIEFIAAAMKVLRGEADFESMARLHPVQRTTDAPRDWRSERGGLQYHFSSDFLNIWTRLYVLGVPDARRSSVDAYLFHISFSPPLDISRERLEGLLQLKVVHGWTGDGGILRPSPISFDAPAPFNGGYFEYAPLKQPQADFNVLVEMTYLNGPDKDPYTATRLSDITISRVYLTPEQLKQRNNQKLGHLPQTGERAPKDGRYVAIFADDVMNASVPREQRTCTYGAGQWLSPAHVWNPEAGKTQPVHAWWQWTGPDPLATELEKLFPTSTPRRPS